MIKAIPDQYRAALPVESAEPTFGPSASLGERAAFAVPYLSLALLSLLVPLGLVWATEGAWQSLLSLSALLLSLCAWVAYEDWRELQETQYE